MVWLSSAVMGLRHGDVNRIYGSPNVLAKFKYSGCHNTCSTLRVDNARLVDVIMSTHAIMTIDPAAT